MDPRVALCKARRAADTIQHIIDSADPDTGENNHAEQVELIHFASELAEYFQALDGWLVRGGFSPWTAA